MLVAFRNCDLSNRRCTKNKKRTCHAAEGRLGTIPLESALWRPPCGARRAGAQGSAGRPRVRPRADANPAVETLPARARAGRSRADPAAPKRREYQRAQPAGRDALELVYFRVSTVCINCVVKPCPCLPNSTSSRPTVLADTMSYIYF